VSEPKSASTEGSRLFLMSGRVPCAPSVGLLCTQPLTLFRLYKITGSFFCTIFFFSLWPETLIRSGFTATTGCGIRFSFLTSVAI